MNARILRSRPTSAAIITLGALAGAADAQSVLAARLVSALPEMQSLHAVGVAGSGPDASMVYRSVLADGSSSVGLYTGSSFVSFPGPSSGSSLSQFRSADWSFGATNAGTGAGSSGAGAGRAVLYDYRAGAGTNLHFLDDSSPPGGLTLSSVARAVSLDGQRAVGSVVQARDGAVSSRAVVWNDKSSPVLALRMADGFDSSDALACDNSGSLIAGFVASSVTGSSRAALWSGNSLTIVAGPGDGPDEDCDGRFVSMTGDGQSALFQGQCLDASGVSRASSAIFRPSEGAWFALPGPGDDDDCDDAFATAMSDDALVVGGSLLCDDGSSRAAFWTFSSATGTYAAHDLALYLHSSGVFADGQDWSSVSLRSITGVSSDGLTFVGDAVDSSGASSIFMVTVPTPGATALLGLGGLLAARRRRR
jgi:MYXO-CTERM domain-containing protein